MGSIRVAAKAERTYSDGTVFDSRAEMVRWHELRMLERAGKIKNLRRQVKYPLVINDQPVLIRSKGFPNGRSCNFTADFVYLDLESVTWPIVDTVEDYKGIMTDAERLRIAVFEAIYGLRVKITGAAQLRGSKRRVPKNFRKAAA